MKIPKHFFEAVFRNTLQEHHMDLEIRCVHQRRSKEAFWPKQFWCRGLREIGDQWSEIQELNQMGYEIHFTVVPRLRIREGKKEHPLPEPLIVCCFWADLDVGEGKPYRTIVEALKQVRRVRPLPNIIVESGSGLHCYYLLKRPYKMDRERFELLLSSLAKLLRGDKGAARATRLMRVPNTLNWKLSRKGKLARERHMSSKGYSLDRLERYWIASEASKPSLGSKQNSTGQYLKFFEGHLDRFSVHSHGAEATARCPFHEDRHPSFSVNLNSGLWLCRANSCLAKGNVQQFCERLRIPFPNEMGHETSGFGHQLGRKSSQPKLNERALHGLAGDFVRAIEPNSEADPVALLGQFLVAFGNCVGPRPHVEIEATKHRANLFCIVVGRSSKSRKGTSWAHVRRMFYRIDQNWVENQIVTGLSSGEGLIWAARDPEKPKKNTTKSPIDDDTVEIVDKRFLVLQSEFARVLKVQRREGNTLSAVLRSAWDAESLSILTKNSPVKATGAHVSIIGHITQDELRRELTATDEANGYANRFDFMFAERSKLLPFGGRVDERTLTELANRLSLARRFGRSVDRVRFSKHARKVWRKNYPELSKEVPGMLGAITSRSEAQVLRLALVYALLGCSQVIRTVHLRAALAFWKYCDQSAAFIFGTSMGDPVADKILKALQDSKNGLTRDEIRELFKHNLHKSRIDEALEALKKSYLITRHRKHTGGRAAEKWTAA